MVELASEPTFFFTIAGLSIPTTVISFSAYEWISHYYTVKLTLSTPAVITPLDSAIGKEGVLKINGNDDDWDAVPRFFHGIIIEFEHIGICQQRYIYEVELVPAVWRLTLRRNCRIFQEMTVQNIVKQILQESGVAADCYRFALINSERKRGFCVQYRESDFDFISRLLEEEGIFYFFQHSEDKHVMIFSDDKAVHPSIAGNKSIPFNTGGMSGDADSIKAFTFCYRLRPQAFAHRNFNFKRPSLDLTSISAGSHQKQPEVYDYPGLHVTQERGRILAKVRMEELAAQQSEGCGQTSCCRLIPGHIFTLIEHDSQCFNTDYLITGVSHSGSQPQSLEEISSGGFCYDNEFTVIPASVPFRPPITVRKPTIPGVQSAIVVGPPGYDIHTDEYGRIKVRFHWDRDGKADGRSSCWLRINQPWSGSRWGIMAIPRVGDEVLVAFLDGDPDRPVVAGALNNGDSPALYQLPANQTQTGIRTQSIPSGGYDNFHELRFEDKKGSEEIYLQSERDWNILVKNDKVQTIGNDERLLVKNDRDKSVQMNQYESIGVNKTIKVGADHQEEIGADMRTTVGANSVETVGLAKELTVGGFYQVSIGGVMNESVAGAKTEEVGMAKAVVVGADMRESTVGSRDLDIGGKLQITAGDCIEINCGKSILRMESDGSVLLNGSRIGFEASGILKATAEDIQLN